MVENPRVTDEQNGAVITEDEAALYDRQIRLWGLDAQKRLEISNVFSCRQDSFKLIIIRKLLYCMLVKMSCKTMLIPCLI